MPVEGLGSLSRRYTVAIPKSVRKAARRALEKSADEYIAMMRRLVPADEGKLAASIGWTWGKPPKGSFVVTAAAGPDETAITIYAGDATTIVTNKRGIEFQNAFIQEFGANPRKSKDFTSTGRAANPFFYPTHRALKKRSTSRVTREIRKAIKNG